MQVENFVGSVDETLLKSGGDRRAAHGGDRPARVSRHKLSIAMVVVVDIGFIDVDEDEIRFELRDKPFRLHRENGGRVGRARRVEHADLPPLRPAEEVPDMHRHRVVGREALHERVAHEQQPHAAVRRVGFVHAADAVAIPFAAGQVDVVQIVGEPHNDGGWIGVEIV